MSDYYNKEIETYRTFLTDIKEKGNIQFDYVFTNFTLFYINRGKNTVFAKNFQLSNFDEFTPFKLT